MKLFHSAVLAMSMALMVPFGSVSAESPNSSVSLALTESRTLDLRTVGSRLVVETLEDALRQGGLALFDEGFQLDSSLSWVFGEDIEDIEGGIDFAIPLLNIGEHVFFTQPGLMFWTGLGEEERIDGSIGVVYRTSLANTPIGIDAIGGASVFYDWDLHRVGHERLGIGADIQSGAFHGTFNYYHPLSNEEQGREEYLVEKALRGMDVRVALERNIVRAGARVGYWREDGGADVTDEWRTSVGFDAGFRVAPGVFIEGDWEKHKEDFVVDQRFKLGLAFRFSLPDFKGASYGPGEMLSNLYKIFDREKRILYEERAKIPTVELDYEEEEPYYIATSGENTRANVTLVLSESFSEDVTVHLVPTGTAEYGLMGDWQIHSPYAQSNSGDSMGAQILCGNPCEIIFPAGQTRADVEISANAGAGMTLGVRIEVPQASAHLVQPVGVRSLSFDIIRGVPFVSLAYSGSRNIQTSGEGSMITATLTMDEGYFVDTVVNLVPTGTAEYGLMGDWQIHSPYAQSNSGDSMGAQILCGNPCEIIFPALPNDGDRAQPVRADIQIAANAGAGETLGVRIEIPQESTVRVQPNPDPTMQRLNFNIVR